MKPAVLVTDGDQRAALAMVRSLGRGGYQVHVTGPRRRVLAGASRHARAYEIVTDPLASPDRYRAELAGLVGRWGIDVVLPVTEPSLLAVLERPEELGDTVIPFPDRDRFLLASDKAAMLRRAPDVGLAAPRSVRLDAPDDLDADAPDLRYPLVLKPARSVADDPSGRHKLSVRHAADPDALRREIDALPAAAYPLLVQERIDGPGAGIFLLAWDGAVRAVFAHRRIREKPPSGGVSVYRESVAADPEHIDAAAALLASVGWNGVAMVELKLDERDGTPYLMEVNGRFWGSLQLAVDSGVDFPMLLVEAALGAPTVAPPEYRTGIRSRWLWGDIDHLLIRLRRSAVELDLPPGAPGRLRTVMDFLRVRRADRLEVLRLRDPAPFVRETLDWLARR